MWQFLHLLWHLVRSAIGCMVHSLPHVWCTAFADQQPLPCSLWSSIRCLVAIGICRLSTVVGL